MDLKFPHHENEIAQSCGATGARFANLLDAQRLRATWTARRCPSRWAISSRCAKCCRSCGIRKCCVTSWSPATTAARINYTLENLQQADATLGGFYSALRGSAGARGAAPTRTTGAKNSAPRWTMTSIRPGRWPSCRRLAREINERQAGLLRSQRPGNWAPCSAKLARLLGRSWDRSSLEADQWFRLPAARRGGRGVGDLRRPAAIDGADRGATGCAQVRADFKRTRTTMPAHELAERWQSTLEGAAAPAPLRRRKAWTSAYFGGGKSGCSGAFSARCARPSRNWHGLAACSGSAWRWSSGRRHPAPA